MDTFLPHLFGAICGNINQSTIVLINMAHQQHSHDAISHVQCIPPTKTAPPFILHPNGTQAGLAPHSLRVPEDVLPPKLCQHVDDSDKVVDGFTVDSTTMSNAELTLKQDKSTNFCRWYKLRQVSGGVPSHPPIRKSVRLSSLFTRDR